MKILFKIPKTAEYDEEAAKYFLIIEEVLLSLKHTGYFETYGLQFIEQFITQVLSHFVKNHMEEDGEEFDITQHPTVAEYVLGVIRFLILMQTQAPQVDRLVAAMTSFLKEIISKQTSTADGDDEGDDQNDEQWGHMFVSSVATLLMADRKEEAKEVSLSIIQSNPKYR